MEGARLTCHSQRRRLYPALIFEQKSLVMKGALEAEAYSGMLKNLILSSASISLMRFCSCRN
jgi:hypothetical protein